MIAEYGMSIRKAVWGTPLAAVHALVPARRVRMGDDSLPSPADRAASEARTKAKSFLAAHYNILPPGAES